MNGNLFNVKIIILNSTT